MPDRYAPALLLDVFVFWFVLRWLLPGGLLLLFGRLLILMMVVGTLGTFAQHHYVWAAFFAGAAWLSWSLLRRWRVPHNHPRLGPRIHWPSRSPWCRATPAALAALCEQRIGARVDAATPVTLAGHPPVRRVIALAGDAVWVLDDESSHRRGQIGRVLARWARHDPASHVEPSRHSQTLELSWPMQGALVRGRIKQGPLADAFAGQLPADELARGN